jgi:hypothetical protein
MMRQRALVAWVIGAVAALGMYDDADGGNVDCKFILSAGTESGDLHEQLRSFDAKHPLTLFMKRDGWTHFDIDIDRTSGALDVFVDGNGAFTIGDTPVSGA